MSSAAAGPEPGALDKRTSTARAEESPASVALHRERWSPESRPRPNTARRYRAGPAEAARAPLLVRIRIKHHLLQFLLGVARLLPHHIAGDVHLYNVLRACDDDGRLVRKSRHGRKAAALHDVDELAVPLVRRDGVLDVLVETNNVRLPLLVDLCGDRAYACPPPRRRATTTLRFEGDACFFSGAPARTPWFSSQTIPIGELFTISMSPSPSKSMGCIDDAPCPLIRVGSSAAASAATMLRLIL